MVHLVAVPETITASGCACVFIDTIFRLHGLPRELVSDRDPRFTADFWRSVFKSLGTRLKMSTSDHPESDGQTERANRVLEEILRGYVHSFKSWSEFLPMVEFAINNSVHASTTHTPFYVNGLRHPRVPTLLECNSGLRGEGLARAKTDLVHAHHALTKKSLRLMPISITSISKKMMPVRVREALTEEDDPSESAEALTEEEKRLMLLQCAHSALKLTSHQMSSYWLVKR
uniref:Integrase catalytic domain-containing protein n=1 Tax=Peronospora matthiolae TaxID=2874970 RepID=A0AAV1TBL7_9STRA